MIKCFFLLRPWCVGENIMKNKKTFSPYLPTLYLEIFSFGIGNITFFVLALVKPLIKKTDIGPLDTNYRPVSNLKYFSKVLECAALEQITEYCESNNLLPSHQSAYRKGYSCETMLLKLTDLILNGMENKLISTVIACDLSAAFDTVNHQILLKTFENYYGISGSVLNWIR